MARSEPRERNYSVVHHDPWMSVRRSDVIEGLAQGRFSNHTVFGEVVLISKVDHDGASDRNGSQYCASIFTVS